MAFGSIAYYKYSTKSLATKRTVARAQIPATCFGDAQISTARSVFGGSSMLFDGTGDYFTIGTSTGLTFSGDFTFECRVYANAITANMNLWYDPTNNRTIQYSGSTFLMYDTSNRNFGNMATGGWHSIAVCRTGSTLTGYYDGALVFTYTSSSSWTFSGHSFGYRAGTGNYWNGNMDEMRISKVGRYTASYTPASSEFANDSDTVLLYHFNGTNGSTIIVDSL